jgi:outer membrane protein assembly factor BamB
MRKQLVALAVLFGTLSAGFLVCIAFGEAPRSASATRFSELPKVAGNDWPWWRGPTANGRSQDRKAPTTWSTRDHVVWKSKVPGRGHSSPIVCGNRIFLTSADEAARQQLVLAFDRKTGKPLWSRVAHRGGFMRKYPKNSHASATPACDGKRVYSVFINNGGLHVIATDLDGNSVWQKEAGAFRSEHGYGSSPVFFKSLVIVNGDSLEGSFIAALSREDGKIVWRTKRKTTGRHGSYATPVIAKLAGKPQLIMTGMGEVSSYNPETGKLIWSCSGPAEVTACTAACGDGLVFATGGFPEKNLLAIRADGVGDVTESHVVWRTGKGVTYVPSPLYYDGYLYVVNDAGVATCFDSKTGKPIWTGRLAGSFSSSPVLVGPLLYVVSETGRTYVLKTGPKMEVIATNDLDGRVLATPTVCGGQIFLRTESHLYCIGNGSAGKS